jgi:sphingolipid delta-4 desaturase
MNARTSYYSKAVRLTAGQVYFANMPQIFPSSISFERYHIKHHSFQGVHELDADLPNRWEAKLINNSFLGKALWLLFYPLFQIFRLSRLSEIQTFDWWIVANVLVQVAFTTAIWVIFWLACWHFYC